MSLNANPEQPSMFFCGQDDWQLVARDLERLSPIEFDDFLDTKLFHATSLAPTSYVGVLSFDDLEKLLLSTYSLQQIDLTTFSSRIYRCKLYKTPVKPRAESPALGESSVLELTPDKNAGTASESDYLKACTKAINDIYAGRFYQINLLRYFNLKLKPRSSEASLSSALLDRLSYFGGPFSCILSDHDFSLISFSPERFLRYSKNGEAVTEPIKGTAPRSSDPLKDRQIIADLTTSEKDQAELNIIVDLLRNDLHRVSNPGSVRVLSGGQVKSFATIHHRVAVISSQLRQNLSMRQLLSSTAPGGSITGAPKLEVLKAIRESEKRSRGFFMGIAFYLDSDSGTFDSSILIRTAVSQDAGKTYEYAAGSGIVADSLPAAELAEINSKCRILTDHFHMS